MIEEKFNIFDVTIKFKFKPKKYDCNHLLVIFSGFGSTTEFAYDFENILQTSNANILWIKDDFDGHCCYYLCKNMNFIIEKAVITFINKKLDELQLTSEQCTLVGASKGGSAALYYGIKYDFNKILISVPQTSIGSYTDKNWKTVAKHMMGADYNNEQIKILDSLITNLFLSDKNKEKNIYLLTSKQDVQYNTEIEPVINELFKYSNMNFLLSESIFVRAHSLVTSHHAQFILGILFILSNNIVPRLGYKVLEGQKQTLIINKSNLPVVKIELINLINNSFFIEGVALLRGVHFNDFCDVNYVLRFLNVDLKKHIDFRMAKGHRPDLTKRYYNGDFVIYDKAWLTTANYEGLNLSKLDNGIYELHLLIYALKENIVKSVPLSFDKIVNLESEAEGRKYSLNNSDGVMILKINK